MLHLSIFVPANHVEAVLGALASAVGVSHVMAGASTTGGLTNISAEVEAGYADDTVDLLAPFDLAANDVTMWRVPAIRPLRWRRAGRSEERDTEVWSEIVGRAHDNSEVVLAYVVFMIAAGVIAGIGGLTGSSILIVGAMAISPDMLPISATAIGIAERRWGLAVRASRALVLGLGIGATSAFVATAVLRLSDRVPDDLVLAATTLGPSLTHLGPGSVMVAAAAGVAGMVSFEKAGGAAVGVAISVTTIPAAAYIGAAIGLGRTEPMGGALLVLATNLVVIIATSAATLEVQRRRRDARAR